MHFWSGRYQEKHYAIFLGKPTRTTNNENREDLISELILLSYGHYFLSSFKTRAKLANVKAVPNIRWNYEGAFLGRVQEFDPNDRKDSSLYHDTFLAVPYITIPKGAERKFSGTNSAGKNNQADDNIGRWMDAYAHHVLEDSDGYLVITDLQGVVYASGEVVLFDPQGHTSLKDSGYWDKGQEGMNEWMREHKCNRVCKQLKLTPQVPVIDPPPAERP
ncbi:hypothetical protein H1R20_g1900, partial [Candolleomyces eurysporus]